MDVNLINKKFIKRKSIAAFFILLSLLSFSFCGKEKVGEAENNVSSKGIGPVSSVTLGPIDESMVQKGKKQFEAKCSACHKFEEKVVGPALKGVTERRTPEWIMNMILNPTEMTQKDPVAMGLLAEHLTQMTFQNVKESEAREILEYFRKSDKK
ncbi:cytochrome C [Leptospira fainei serovar Hurstbridge str. BUT 6]|uniref:Cytochrome C n=1 Tax=Leptospira fainei serovar Hurstbridge str. BUT 6 TaxID=1193011 RepID=S3UWT4_9LEPT|nr:cytochrome c [Leptospira fainei]EPG74856.1 cytochrome C [Leptospira fainei serovar Hurstbridge str. BUT 6]